MNIKKPKSKQRKAYHLIELAPESHGKTNLTCPLLTEDEIRERLFLRWTVMGLMKR